MSLGYKIGVIGGTIVGLIAFTWLFVYLGNKHFPREETVTINEAAIIAESWIMNFSSTYPRYGRDLELIGKEEKERGVYEFVFAFVTEDPEYGRRENEIHIKTKDTEVVEAVTNETFDEMAGEYIEEEKTISLYFVRGVESEEDEALRQTQDEEEVEPEMEVVPVERVVVETERTQEDVLRKLFRGPTDEEEFEGYETKIEDDIEIFSFSIEEGVAYVELSTRLGELPPLAERQIENTLTQFEDISSVEEPEREGVTVLDIEGIPEGFSFDSDLEEGDSREDVKYLQIVLNADPDTKVAETGPGSPGNEIENFGPATTQAVMDFQRKYADEVLDPAGLVLSTGVVDEYTRDKLNAILEASAW